MLFWSFFEQAGSSVNNFTDRNVDRVFEERVLTAEDVGEGLVFAPSQEQLGFSGGEAAFLMDDLQDFREGEAETAKWQVTDEHVGMAVGGSEIPASTFQAANPIFILLFAPIFTLIWTYTSRKGWEPSTPVKFGLGLLQLGLGFAALWYGASQADGRGMVALPWLLLGYLLHTTGELCLSPVGLSMVTRLSPTKLVSTVMGAWFLATAFSAYVAGIIATFTGVSHGPDGSGGIPAPLETVHIYGGVFGQIAIAAIASAVIMFALAPLLTKWMHEDELAQETAPAGH
jgi:POT family proton-dependent oligopeptide transporter